MERIYHQDYPSLLSPRIFFRLMHASSQSKIQDLYHAKLNTELQAISHHYLPSTQEVNLLISTNYPSRS